MGIYVQKWMHGGFQLGEFYLSGSISNFKQFCLSPAYRIFAEHMQMHTGTLLTQKTHQHI